MKTFETIEAVKDFIKDAKTSKKTIGFVPTMGFLHEGHLSLVEAAKKDCDLVITSIFVNPMQFGQGEDFERYPKSIERDMDLLSSRGVDGLFIPKALELYPEGFQTYVEVHEVTKNLCGASRPGHFKGVTTVVAKLLNIVEADKAYFGLKDAQQVQVIRRMVLDLNMNTEIIPLPIVREVDGLAMSSRNSYLDFEQRKAALILSQALKKAKSLIENGEKTSKKIREEIVKLIKVEPLAKIDYVEIIDFDSFKETPEIKKGVLIALAVWIGQTRLIDNFLWEG